VDLVSPKKRNEIKPYDDQCRVFLVAKGGTPKCTPAVVQQHRSARASRAPSKVHPSPSASQAPWPNDRILSRAVRGCGSVSRVAVCLSFALVRWAYYWTSAFAACPLPLQSGLSRCYQKGGRRPCLQLVVKRTWGPPTGSGWVFAAHLLSKTSPTCKSALRCNAVLWLGIGSALQEVSNAVETRWRSRRRGTRYPVQARFLGVGAARKNDPLPQTCGNRKS
jgi:hypothetical protein